MYSIDLKMFWLLYCLPHWKVKMARWKFKLAEVYEYYLEKYIGQRAVMGKRNVLQ